MPTGDAFGAFASALAGTLGQGLLEKQRREQAEARAALEREFVFLNSVINDSSGQFNNLQRDAATFALTQLDIKKPGAGTKAYQKRTKELEDQRTPQPFGAVQPGGGGAAQTTPSGMQGPPDEVGATSPAAGQAGAPPGPGGLPMGGAALPSTSPVAQTGSAAGAPPMGQGAGAGAPPQAQGGAQQAPPLDLEGEAPPSEQQLLAFGASQGMQPPERVPRPAAPDPYTATRWTWEQHKQDMLAFKSGEERYVDYLNRQATEVRLIRQQRQEQRFRREEAVAGRTFAAEQAEKERASRERIAGITASTREDPDARGARRMREQALGQLRRDLAGIDRARNEFGGALQPEEKERRREEARQRYEQFTGEAAPRGEAPAAASGRGGTPRVQLQPGEGGGGGGGFAPDSLRREDAKKGRFAPDSFLSGARAEGPPRAPEEDKGKGGKGAASSIRSVVEDMRRQKVPQEQICEKIAFSPTLKEEDRAAAMAYARCPQRG